MKHSNVVTMALIILCLWVSFTADEEPERIVRIWMDYHAQKEGVVAAVLTRAEFDVLRFRSVKRCSTPLSPCFVGPERCRLPRQSLATLFVSLHASHIPQTRLHLSHAAALFLSWQPSVPAGDAAGRRAHRHRLPVPGDPRPPHAPRQVPPGPPSPSPPPPALLAHD